MISVVGSANIDLTFRAPRLPRPGETALGKGYFQGFGGKGANQAVAAARLGAQVAFVGKVGADDFGRAIREQLIREGVDVTYLGTDPDRPTGTAAILVDDKGENAIVVVPGANLGLTRADVRAAEVLLRSSRIVLAPCETDVEALVEAFRIGHAAGAICVLNPAPVCELPEDFLHAIDVCVPNETELRQLTGLDSESLDAVAEAAHALRRRGPEAVVVTLGGRGALVVGAGESVPVAPVPVKAVDTSGAGDAFCGALSAYFADGDSLVPAAQKANRVAALSVMRAGTQASFPRRDEL